MTMEVITVDSEVYQLFKERLDRIEKYIERNVPNDCPLKSFIES